MRQDYIKAIFLVLIGRHYSYMRMSLEIHKILGIKQKDVTYLSEGLGKNSVNETKYYW